MKAMNEKRKTEGELIEAVFSDDRSRAQKLLEKLKEREQSKSQVIVKIGKYTWYLLPEVTDMEKWKERKKL